MGRLFSYFLPRQHTSWRRSLAICCVAALASLPLDVAAYWLMGAEAAIAPQWAQLVLLLGAWSIRMVPAASAALAFCSRRGLIDTGELALQAMLVRDYLRSLLPGARGQS